MVIAAGAEAANLDLDVFMKQGQDYREKVSPFDRFSRLLRRPQPHPPDVRAASARADGVGQVG